MTAHAYKQPVSVLVLIYTADHEALLIERAKHPGYWQSVTGSREGSDSLLSTAQREVQEETGIAVAESDVVDWHMSHRFEIFEQWRHRYAPGVTHNEEHVFSLCLPTRCPVTLSPDEHRAYRWLPLAEAADACFSWSNRDALLMLAERGGPPGDNTPTPSHSD